MIFSAYDVIVLAIAGAVVIATVMAVSPYRQPKSKKKKETRVEKAKRELKAIKKEVEPPPDVPPAPAVQSQGMEQFPIPRTLQVEFLRKRADGKWALIRRGRVNLVPRFGVKDVFWFFTTTGAYFVDTGKIIRTEIQKGKKTIVVEKLVYDIFNSEPLNPDGSLTWSWDVEHLWRDSGMDQYITVATFEGGFQVTPELRKAIIVVGILAVLLGLSLNGALGLTPKEIIHYVP